MYRVFVLISVYLSHYFINLLKFHPGSCTRSFIITGQHVSQLVCIFTLALSSAVLLGVCDKTTSPPMSPAVYNTFLIFPFMCLFSQGSWFNTLDFRKKCWGLRSTLEFIHNILDGSAMFLRVSLWFFCPLFFQGGSKLFWVSFTAISAQPGLEVPSWPYQTSPLLSSGPSLIKIICTCCSWLCYRRGTVYVTLCSFLIYWGLPLPIPFYIHYSLIWKEI